MLVLAFSACTDDLVPLTAHWNQAQAVMLKRVAALKASVAEAHAAVMVTPGMSLNTSQSQEVRARLRSFEQSVRELEELFQTNEDAVSLALQSGKLSVGKPAVDRAEADFDAAVVRLYPVPKQIKVALEATAKK